MPPISRTDSANNSTNMRVFEGRYFNINRRLAMCLGIWPYEMKEKKIFHRAIIMSSLTFLAIPQFISIYLHHENIDRLMLSVMCFTAVILMNLKVMGMILAEDNMKAVYMSIARNWQRIEDYCERVILHEYSERARTATIVYAAMMASSAVFASSLPLIPKILDFLIPLEYPRSDIYLSEGEFFIDRKIHFLPPFFLDYFGLLVIALVMITVDTMYIVSVEHCCAMYAIIRSRLLELKAIIQIQSSKNEAIDSYEWLRCTIQLHRDALTFTKLLNDSYSTTFLFVLITALYIFPCDSCAIIANLDNPLRLIPYAVCFVAMAIHGFFLTYPGQRIIDHQLGLLDAAYGNEWYAAPLRTRKLLLIFMLRCSQPVRITAGYLLPMNFEIYFKIMRTSVSYITVASSFR